MKLFNIKNIHAAMKEIADNHLQLQSFFWGPALRAVNEQELKYPCLIAFPASVEFESSTMNVITTCFVLDRVLKDMSNVIDVESDTLEIIKDIVQAVNSNYYENCYINLSGTLQPVADNFKDEVWGWQFDIRWGLPKERGTCQAAFESNFLNLIKI